MVLVARSDDVRRDAHDAAGIAVRLDLSWSDRLAPALEAPRCAPPNTRVDAVLAEWSPACSDAFVRSCVTFHTWRVPVVAVVPAPAWAPTALFAGADAVQLLPLSVDLLRAQTAAYGRSAERLGKRAHSPPVFEWAGGSLDMATGTLSSAGRSVRLPPRQADFLACFVRSPGRLLSREALLSGTWGYTFDPGTSLVEVYVHHLRQAFRSHGVPLSIETVRGRGYCLHTV